MDDTTLTYHLMREFRPELQDAWGMDGSDSQDPQFVANWAIKKETKMASIKFRRHEVTSREKTISPRNPRNQNRTCRPQNDNPGDPMELDAIWKRPVFNISAPRIPTKDEKQSIPQMRQTRTPSRYMLKTG